MFANTIKQALTSATLLSLAACGGLGQISDIGQAPDMTPIKDIKAPVAQRSISLPMPNQERKTYEPNSLWRTGARAFFKDQRAARVGDILTVEINIDDNAQIGNSTARSRSTTEGAGLTNFFGLETAVPNLFTSRAKAEADPAGTDAKIRGAAGVAGAYDPSKLVGANSNNNYTGAGTVDRSESIDLTVAAIVTDVLPNGNMVIQGRQEVRVNFEKRELLIAGIVRPEDISSSNVVQHTQIAEARISYGGKGQITAVQQPRYGAQLYDIIFPF